MYFRPKNCLNQFAVDSLTRQPCLKVLFVFLHLNNTFLKDAKCMENGNK